MSIISNPYKSLKDQALKIWDTKDFAERLAFNRTNWFMALMWGLMGVMILHIFIVLVVSDLLILAHYYYHTVWYIDLVEDIFFETIWLQIGLIYFWCSPKVIRFELLIWKKYNDKEKQFFDNLEGRIKQRFPSFKTSAQRARERLEKPKKEPSKAKKWLNSRPPMERNFIRATIWIAYVSIMSSFFFFMFNMDSVIFNCNFDFGTGNCYEIDRTNQEMLDKIAELEEKLPPTKPDGRPPPTIYDIFINEPDLVTP